MFPGYSRHLLVEDYSYQEKTNIEQIDGQWLTNQVTVLANKHFSPKRDLFYLISERSCLVMYIKIDAKWANKKIES